ncbi:MAG: EFR1 family ferrodoxin [Solobacterium sp.]|nr:EFR1 family ferrodoxin [Solobacterium sp.]
MKICYFTATGNCLYVAKRIGGELFSIPQLMKEDKIIISDETIGIICPVYAGEMPGMVRSFLSKAVLKANYVFFIYTYGMSSSVARPNAISAAKKAGIKLDYVNTIKMVDNYLPGFEIQNQIDTAPQKDIEGQIAAVCHDIEQRKKNVSDLNLLHKASIAIVGNTMGRALLKGNNAKSYIVNDQCIKCGICAKVCPANNITVTDRVYFSDHCEVCYACLHHCPKNAIHLKNERSSVRFRNEHITLKEIIDVNQ